MNKFFIIGSSRTGTTLLTRCIDDHPLCICLFEGYIQRQAFGCPVTRGHSGRMKQHGFTREQTDLLRSKVYDKQSFLNWYEECATILKPLYDKPMATHIGDGVRITPSVYSAIQSFPKILTVRDPRAVRNSGKYNYLPRYAQCLKFCLPRLDDTTLVIKFEDLVLSPEKTMARVYKFLHLSYDDSFLDRKPKPYDQRFNFNKNSTQPFDRSIVDKWKKCPQKPISSEIIALTKGFGYFEETQLREIK